MNQTRATAWLTIACLALSWSAQAGPAPDTLAPLASGVTTLRCGTLIDGSSAIPRRDVEIRVEDGRIVSVGAFMPDSAGVVHDDG